MKEQAYEVFYLPDGTARMEEGGVRSFLVTGSDKALLIDTGFGTGDLKTLCESLTDLPITLVNTHADRDHTGCNEQFDGAFMHTDDFTRARRSLPEDYPLKPVAEGDVFDLGGSCLEVLHIPGHTPGSIALLDRDSRILFSGDSVQSGDIYMFGEGRDFHSYLHSMQRLYGMGDLFDTIYPSHSGIPVSPALLPILCDGAEKALEGALRGVPMELHGTTVRRCDIGGASFLLA